MQLKSFRVKEFRSVYDSGDVEVGDVVCLVGKNEAGKTSLLQALYRLNPIDTSAEFDATEDYPRSEVEDYNLDVEAGKRKPAEVVVARFELDGDDLEIVANELGSGALAEPVLELSRGYDNELNFEFKIDSEAIAHYLVEHNAVPSEWLTKEFSGTHTLKAALQARAQSAASEAAALKLQAAAQQDGVEKAKLEKAATECAEPRQATALRAYLEKFDAEQTLISLLAARVPKFLYFDEYNQMEGCVNLEELQKRTKNLLPSDFPMMGLLELARIDIATVGKTTKTQELFNKLEGASNHLTKHVLKYWSQNTRIRVAFDIREALANDPENMRTGHNIWGRVIDSVHNVSTLIGARSRGFIWFFSFLAWFMKEKKRAEPFIVLLDEPGLFLHGKAQGDLLRFIDVELKDHQVLYTTHSPFMVPTKRFDRVRIVEDRSMESVEPPRAEAGTKVLSDVLKASKGTLFPLQGALGYDLAQSLFVGPHSLIVEGVSDLIYIQVLSALLKGKGRVGIDERWTITPVGGADKVPAFAALFAPQSGLQVATLIDFARKSEQSIQNLYKGKILEQSHVLTYAAFTGSAEADVEDMFEPAFYVDLVNQEYAKEFTAPIDAATLPLPGARILKRIAEAARTGGVGSALNHYRPARHLAEAAKAQKKVSDATLERFEKAFTTLNGLLK